MILSYAKKIFMTLTLTIMVGVVGLAIVAKIQGGNFLSVQSGSMVPALNKGDLVSVKRVPTDKLKPGDIITFINPLDSTTTITHRIIARASAGSGNEFITKGDANNAPDVGIDANQIVGKANYSLPYVGYGMDFMRKPLGLILIIYIPAMGIIISELKRLAKYYKSQQPYFAVGRKEQLADYGSSNLSVLKVLPLILLVPLFFTFKAYATLQNTAALTGNTISSSVFPTPNTCTGTGNSTTTTVNVNGSGGSSNNNSVNVSNSNNQNAQSGNATNSNNTNGGSATSGNATNCNSTNINISITNP